MTIKKNILNNTYIDLETYQIYNRYNEELELDQTEPISLLSSELENKEVPEHWGDVQLFIDSPISWNLIDYLFFDKTDHLRIIMNLENLKYINLSLDNNLEKIFKFPKTLCNHKNLEIEVQMKPYEEELKDDMQDILHTYIPYIDYKSDKIYSSGTRWGQILKSIEKFTPNIIETKDNELVTNFNTSTRFDKNKPLVLINITNKGYEIQQKSLILLDAFRLYKETYYGKSDFYMW